LINLPLSESESFKASIVRELFVCESCFNSVISHGTLRPRVYIFFGRSFSMAEPNRKWKIDLFLFAKRFIPSASQ
jgi:hypothetical protein